MERPKTISNEELLILTKQAFEQDEVVDFLQGAKGYACPVNRFVPANVPTDFNRILEYGVYKLYSETKDKTIVSKLRDAILELTKGNPVQVWVAYVTCWGQIYYEQNKKSPFSEIIDNNIFNELKQALFQNEDKLRSCKEWQGWNKEDGLWSEISRLANILKKDYGVSVL